ncbi:hypothetical protein Drorol1_Dr00005350 [Drosera rotundifolia]
MIHNRDWDIYNQLSASLSFGHNGYSVETSEEASPSSQKSPNSDEDVRLASSYPKKRAGRKKFKETRHPVYRGVRQRNGNKWVCEVRTPNNNSRIWLGTYPTAEMAARAHDVAALALRGRNACLNFADSASILPLPDSMSIADIQRKAAEAANLFHPAKSSQQSVAVTSQQVKTHTREGLNTIKNVEMDNSSPQHCAYTDEETVFEMPMLLSDMAEGLLLPPPHVLYSSFSSDETGGDCEVSLWNY